MVKESKTPKGSMVMADKGYASRDNRCDLEENHITDGIMYKAARGRKLTEAEKLMNRVISGIRGKVERAFGTLKKGLWLPAHQVSGHRQGQNGIPSKRHGLQPQESGPHGGVVRPQGEKRPQTGRNGLIGGRGKDLYRGFALIHGQKPEIIGAKSQTLDLCIGLNLGTMTKKRDFGGEPRKASKCLIWRRGWDSNPRTAFWAVTRFRVGPVTTGLRYLSALGR